MGWMTNGGDGDDGPPDTSGYIEPSWAKGKGRHEGEWLIRAEAGLEEGHRLEVESKATGKVQWVTIDEKVWEGQGVGLYTVRRGRR